MSASPDPVRHNVVVGVGGGIAAYKMCGLVRLFKEAGHVVHVVPTESALKFVGTATWAALSGNPVRTGVWEDVHEVPHVRLGQSADLVIVAPATADLLSRASAGAADDLLTGTLLTARCPVVMAPAMHTEMWEHPATQDNASALRSRGVILVPPDSGRLTGADTGPGRLPDVESLYSIGLSALTHDGTPDLRGKRVLISAGGTREAIDPVRYLGNCSSGRMGYALSAAAVARGAEVEVVAADVALPAPAGVSLTEVRTASEMAEAVFATPSDLTVMAAAVADFRPDSEATQKLKKGSSSEPDHVKLTRTEDILAGLVERRTERSSAEVIVGFAAETGDDERSFLELGQEKLDRKGCDLLVVNDVAAGKAFGAATNEAVILSAMGPQRAVPLTSKEELANRILDAAAPLL